MGDKLAVGMIGAGGIARSHIGAMQQVDNIRLVAVMDVNEAQAKAVAEPHGARVYGDLAALLEDAEVEGVHVCTPHSFHADQVVAAAEAGKHVLVEKPMALTVADCDRMIAASEVAGKVLMVGQVMRHYPVNHTIKRMLADGVIGRVGHLIRRRYSYFDPTGPTSAYRSWYLDREIGGHCLLYGFGSHEYDTLHWYMDSPVVRVYAQATGSTELYAGQEDSYSTIMTHENGAISTLTQSVVCHSGTHDQFIIGSKGTLMLSGDRLTLNGTAVEVDGSNSEGMPNQVRDFADCCLSGRQPDASGQSVRHTMAVIEAAQLSVQRDAPVMLSELEP